MPEKKFEVTHYYRSPPSNEGWVQTDFITYDRNNLNGDYFLGFEESPFPKAKIEKDIINGSLFRLPFPKEINEDESIWVTENQDIIIADAYDPSQGTQEFIRRDNVTDSYDTITTLIERVIAKGTSEGSEEKLENFVTAGGWKLLLGQVLKYISWGDITEKSNFEYFGYLFIHVQKLFEHEFTEFANKEKFAIAYGSLCFETSTKKFERWEILLLEDVNPVALFGDEYELEDSSVEGLLREKSSQINEYFEMQA